MLRTCQFLTILTSELSGAQAWCKFCRCQLPKVVGTCQFLTILTSKSLWRAGVVQILRSSTSKSGRNMPVFNDFDFRIVWRAGVVQILSMSTSKSGPGVPVFNDFDFQIAVACRRGANFVDILGSRSFATPGPTFASLRSDKTMEKHSISRNSYPPKHLSCENIDAARATGNFPYSRKLELLNFL